MNKLIHAAVFFYAALFGIVVYSAAKKESDHDMA